MQNEPKIPPCPDTPCREYQGYRDKGGYGRRSRATRKRFGTAYVHRQVMVMAGHDIQGKVVMHLCDNPACFRYDHLFIGTQADNVADNIAKGRFHGSNKVQKPINHGTNGGYTVHHARGEQPCEPCREAHNAYGRDLYRRTHA